VIPIALRLLGEEKADAARAAVLSGWGSLGLGVAAFGREFAMQGGLASTQRDCRAANPTGAKAEHTRLGDRFH
jgi:perosamine synthetase